MRKEVYIEKGDVFTYAVQYAIIITGLDLGFGIRYVKFVFENGNITDYSIIDSEEFYKEYDSKEYDKITLASINVNKNGKFIDYWSRLNDK